MDKAMPKQQRGMSFGGFIFGAFVLVLVAIFGFRLIPAYVQDAQINSIFREISNAPDMQKATPHDIKNSFDRRASVDAITAIHANDIDISDDGGRPVLSASYSVRIPVIANISLIIEFNPSSAGN
jgi:hypothetical protein